MSGGRKVETHPPDDREPQAPVAPETKGGERPGPCWIDPFESLTEWSSPIDNADYADL